MTRWALLVTALSMLGFPAPSSAAQLDIVVNGPGTILATIPDASGPETASVVCTSADNFEPFDTTICRETSYLPGRVVTLHARAIPIDRSLYSFGLSSFVMWSDDRCPSTPVCELPIDSDRQSITASFSPQKLTVFMSDSPQGPGRLTSLPPGFACEALLFTRRECVAVFPAFTTVQLIAEGARPRWTFCDTVVGSTCSVMASHWRQVTLRWPGGQLGGLGAGRELQFRVAKDGSGSGTVKGDDFDCGTRCTRIVEFGTRATFTAFPDDGSRFVGWRGACGEAPRCSLEMGPVTRVTAMFRRGSAGGSKQPPASSPAPPPFGFPPSGSDRPFIVVVEGRVVVRGARPRRVHVTVRVSARSSIHGVLETARGRRVTANTWQIPRGRSMLRLAVPRRARRGTHVLRITARDGREHVKRFTRRVRLPR